MRFDLHCHSTCSDGAEPPERVAERAAERAVAVFALTDHDTCAGSSRTRVPNARVVRAVELSCADPDSARSIHVLAYDRGGAGWVDLEARLGELQAARVARVRVMVAKLAQRGVRIDVEPIVAAAATRSVGRPDLARAMVAVGAASSREDAFARHLYDGGPVDVLHRALPLADALALGRAAGAALALAHPATYDRRGVALLRAHRGDGLAGVEAFYAAYDPRERARWIALADELGLVCTAGSDSHGADDGELGVDVPADRAARLAEWLALA
jgi:predicted metal-dependent phosphoesterase TrpH